MIHGYEGRNPDIARAAFIAWNADVSGAVTLGTSSSVWFGSTLRGDLSPIVIGDRTNIQDNCSLHTDSNSALRIGDDVTVGHGAIVHGCVVGSRCTIGRGAIGLSRAGIGDECGIAAGTLVPEGKEIPPRSVVMGVPGRVVRQVDDEDMAGILATAAHYVERSLRTREEREKGA